MQAYRTHHCGELTASHVDEEVKLSGWVFRKRDHGQLLFFDLRDHYGTTQVVFQPSREFFDQAAKVRPESVVTVTGKVLKRTESTINKDMKTGAIEVVVDKFEIQSTAEVLPLLVDSEDLPSEDIRLKNRFLDLRREKLHNNIVLRSKVISKIREEMTSNGFLEIQTPILTSSSPEGARDFLVPSRMHPGKFYALPQAPQQFKQLLMVSGFDRYFQIAPCFRDEDARADRSPGEFYQLDMELAFATQDDVFEINEKLLHTLFTTFASDRSSCKPPFVRIPYRESMLKYGNDKPDLRNPIEIRDATEIFKDSEFKAFAGAISKGCVVRSIPADNVGDKPRSFFDKLVDYAVSEGSKGLAYLVWKDVKEKPKGPIAKFLSNEAIEQIVQLNDVKDGSAVFFACDKPNAAARVAGLVRTKLGDDLELIDKNIFKFCWIVDFPMFEKDEDSGQIMFSHNPFSMPQGGMEALQTKDPLDILAYQYDIVCNGIELSSGAIRNHRTDVMIKAFEIAGYSEDTVKEEFGGMFQAFTYGAPPHGGIAPGVDRIVMLLAGEHNIREVIAFPLNQKAQDLMMGAPSPVKDTQLRDVHLQLNPKAKQALEEKALDS